MIFMGYRENLIGWAAGVIDLPRILKCRLLQLADCAGLAVALWVAYVMRLSDWWPEIWINKGWPLFIFAPLVGVILFEIMGFYQILSRGRNMRFLALASAGVIALLVISYAFIYAADLSVPRTVPALMALILWIYLAGSRFILNELYLWLSTTNEPKKNVVIYGAGSAGVQLLSLLGQMEDFRVRGFIDDDPNLQGNTLSGVKIFSRSNFTKIIGTSDIEFVLLALPSARREERQSIVKWLMQYSVTVKTIPSIKEILSGTEIDTFKDVALADLLGRDTVEPDAQLMSASVLKKSVCITGAGGTIGSEIARQALLLGAKRLVLFEASEFALYQLEECLKEILNAEKIDCEIISILGSVTNQELLDHIFSHYEIQTIYHAAAYKHVPLVEKNPFQGIINNAFGTRVAAAAAQKAGVERFILISSDKAVRPTNVMGASKRLAELVVQDFANGRHSGSIFSMVRFGNVLGSSGSVVPLFKKQIENGGPVTVTHPEVKRFFMSVDEAASLVIQAGSMSKGGEVFVLDMGEGILIKDLAELMISLSGFSVKTKASSNVGIEIKFVGLRPGEKMEEELFLGGTCSATEHPKIMSSNEAGLKKSEIFDIFSSLEEAIKDCDAKKFESLLVKSVSGYGPINK